MEVARVEMVESELDHMIRRRDEKRVKEEGHRPSQEMYMQSVRRYEERLQRERLWSQLRWHEGQARRLSVTLEALISRHRSEIERCEAMLGIEEGGARGEGGLT